MKGFEAAAGRTRSRSDTRESSDSRLRSEVLRHLDYMFEVQIEGEPRRRSLRSSGLPYCPVLDVVLPRENDAADLNRALYTGIGTAAHAALQAFASVGPMGARCWGCWKCPRCGHEWKRPQFRPDRCPSGCNDHPIYVEISYRLRAMSGHSDLLVKYPHGWVLKDYKTTGEKPDKPNAQYLLQARTYCHMLSVIHGITASYCIVYIGRGHLERWVFGPYDYRSGAQQIADWTNRANAGFMAATRARRNPSESNLLEVARVRPCRDHDSYDEYMARKFGMKKNRCMMLGNCCKSGAHVARIMKGLIDGE